jgi:hypothetical protein
MSTAIMQCAKSHNEIVRLGWEGTGQKFDDSAPFKPFWEENESNHPQLQRLARTDLIAFYKEALVRTGPQDDSHDPYQNFFYYLQGLSHPWAEFNREAFETSQWRERGSICSLILGNELGKPFSGGRVCPVVHQT